MVEVEVSVEVSVEVVWLTVRAQESRNVCSFRIDEGSGMPVPAAARRSSNAKL